MRGLLIFTVQNNRYAISLEHIQRIIELPELTNVPNAHPAVNKIMSYEEQVIKVVDFRKLIAIVAYEVELQALFAGFRQEHKAWFDAVSERVIGGEGSTFETNPHQCGLGKWIDGFIPYDERVSAALKVLGHEHKRLHALALDAVEFGEGQREEALFMLQTELHDSYKRLGTYLENFAGMLDVVAASLQKMLIYKNGAGHFAIKVDAIVDIAYIDEIIIRNPDTTHMSNGFLEVEGMIEFDGMLVNIIKSITIPKREVA